MGIEKVVKTAIGTVVGAGVVAGLYFSVIKPSVDASHYNAAMSRALIQYADGMNGGQRDGIVTTDEKDAFVVDLLKDKGVTCTPQTMPKYLNGKEVPITTVTEWLNYYKPSE